MKKILRKAIALGLTVALVTGPLQGLNFNAHAAETTTLTDSDLASAYSETSIQHVSVHDPSVVYDGKGTYYIFGSHLAWAKSTDLIHWTTFTNNINTNYKTIFANNFTWAAMGDSVYDPAGNMWAPDVIYNTELGKWCMYMSINGCSWNSSIAMLTADSLDGNWTYAGTVVYSGFTDSSNNHDFTYTDYDEVTGETTLPGRYIQTSYTCKDGNTATSTTTWNKSTGAHAIDPSVFYGQDGKLYMTYGSWSGGIYILQLSGTTGLRDTSVIYNYVANTSDPYMGIKLAGGYQTSGEASYVEYIDGYYYLFVTNGGLTATGGYNMRVYRSTNPTGPYTDVSGQSPTYIKGTTNTNSDVGTRLMSYYKWNYQEFAQVAQGHNSAMVDPVTGKSFLVYHTRTNDGTEGHSVRVHQLFTTENHYLVAAPFEYSGETISATGYLASDVVGTYEVILQKQSVDYTNLEYCSGQEMKLNTDGTITGAYTGTWTMINGKPYCNLVIDGVTYEGVFVEQTIEGTNIKTMAFTVVGTNDVCIWGAKYPSADVSIAMTKNGISVVSEAYSDITLSTKGLFGATVSWSSSDTSIITNDGKVTAPSEDTNVTLTATIARDNYTYQKSYTVLVHKAVNYNEIQLLSSAFVNNPQDLSKKLDGSLSMANPYLNNTGIDYGRGIKVKFDVQSTGTNRVLATILSFLGNNGDNGRLYFTPGSYLGYNGTGGYFDANLSNYSLVTDYIGKSKATVEISITASGFEVDVNGVKAYDQSITSNAATGSGSVTDYYNVIYWLTHTADTVKFGYGSFWHAATFDEALCTISNVYFYGYLSAPEIPEVHTYSENYNSATAVGSYWTSTNLQGGLSFSYKDTQKQFAQFTVTTTTGTRGAVSLFPSAGQVTGKYTVATDVNLYNANATGYENQFVITNSARTYNTSSSMNSGVASGYVVKLSTTAGSTTWSINDGQASVVIPKSTWININSYVDTTAGTVALKITNKETGEILYTGTVKTSGTGTLQGLYLMGGRTSSVLKVDNIIVDQAFDISNLPITLSDSAFTYDGTAQTPSVTVVNGDLTLIEGTDYDVVYADNTNAGIATLTITGKGNYYGSVTESFNINQVEETSLSATLNTTDYTYDGTEKTPSVTVEYGDTTLTEGTDYTVTYSDNTNIGTATATINLSGNYTGSITKTFNISAASLSAYTVTFVDYNDTVLKTEVVSSGDAATAPAAPSREGYTFSGWDTTFDNVTSDLTVKAKYTVVAITSGDVGVEGVDGTTLDSSYELVVNNILTDISSTDLTEYNNQISTLATGKELVDVFDIKLMSNDVAVQPDGNLKVKIKLSAEQLAFKNLEIIYIDNAGTITILPSTIEDGYITFVTNHFSNYGIIGSAASTDTTSETTVAATTTAATEATTTAATTAATTETTTSTTTAAQTSDRTQVLPFISILIASATGAIIASKKKTRVTNK